MNEGSVHIEPFIIPPRAFRPRNRQTLQSRTHLKEKIFRCEHEAVQMFIFYSFEVPGSLFFFFLPVVSFGY